MIAAGARPRLAAKARLRWDRRGERWMLLYPERGLVLNATAAEIVRRCTGELTAEAIVEAVAGVFPDAPRATLDREVHGLLGDLVTRGVVTLEAGPRGRRADDR